MNRKMWIAGIVAMMLPGIGSAMNVVEVTDPIPGADLSENPEMMGASGFSVYMKCINANTNEVGDEEPYVRAVYGSTAKKGPTNSVNPSDGFCHDDPEYQNIAFTKGDDDTVNLQVWEEDSNFDDEIDIDDGSCTLDVQLNWDAGSFTADGKTRSYPNTIKVDGTGGSGGCDDPGLLEFSINIW